MNGCVRRASLLFGLAALAVCGEANPSFRGANIIPLLPPGPENPRNTEGAFVTLRDGRILFAYSRFTGGSDQDAATIVGRYSSDGGRTWTGTDTPIVPNEGAMNVMSVSLLRLKDGRIALFYLRKNSMEDCRPYLRFSTDEAKTWSEPKLCIPNDGYYVLNNDRAVQLKKGRIILPVAQHPPTGSPRGAAGIAMAYLSDDAGRTWRRSKTILYPPPGNRPGLQEPGIIELKDGRLMMFIRTALGSQYLSFSNDGGETWADATPSDIKSPLSPASIKRIPKTGDLLMVWNDHSNVDEAYRGKRTPFTVAVSRDEGKTWVNKQNRLDDPDGWYCYTAIHFAGNRVLLGFNDGGKGMARLSRTSVAWFDVKSLYPKERK